MLRKGLLCTVAASALLCATVTPGASAAPAVDIKGTWNVTSTYPGGESKYQVTYATTPGGVVTGSATGAGGVEWPVKGGVSGFTLKETDGPYADSHESFLTATIAAAGTSYEGTFKDTNSLEGTVTATRVGLEPKREPEPTREPEPPKPVHGSGMTVICGYDALSSQDTCTATVADTSTSPTAPTGSVALSSAAGGLFAFGPACPLKSSPSASGTSFCAVPYVPPAGGGPPNIVARYPGDATHASATAATKFLLPGGEPGRYESSSSGGGYPNELILEVPVPVPGTEVEAGLTKGAAGASRPSPKRELRASEVLDIIPTMRTEVEEREGEETTPDVAAVRGEVEERARAYEEDVRILSREIAEAKRHPAGLGAASQATENALVAGDLTVLAQIAQQRRSPGLRKGAADQLARLARQGEAIEKGLAEIVKLQREETGDVVKSKKAARGAAARARAKLVAVGYVRRARASGTIKLRIKLKRSTLTRLSRGRSSITLNLRVSMVLPAHLLKGGVPVSSVRQVKLSKGSRRR